MPMSNFFLKFLLEHFEQKKIEINNSVKVNNSRVLSNLGNVDYIVFDKTGTLTTGKYQFKYIYADGKRFINQP